MGELSAVDLSSSKGWEPVFPLPGVSPVPTSLTTKDSMVKPRLAVGWYMVGATKAE